MTQFWAADHDLSAGAVLTSGDLHSVAVRLGDAGPAYLTATTDVLGQQLNRPLSANEIVPRAALGSPAPATTVTIPFGGDNAPRISAGQRITVWVSTKLCPSSVVLADVAVQSVASTHTGTLSATGGEDVIVRVDPTSAQRVIEALSLTGGVLRAGILDGSSQEPTSLPDLAACSGSGS
jgi:hypothetical protein